MPQCLPYFKNMLETTAGIPHQDGNVCRPLGTLFIDELLYLVEQGAETVLKNLASDNHLDHRVLVAHFSFLLQRVFQQRGNLDMQLFGSRFHSAPAISTSLSA